MNIVEETENKKKIPLRIIIYLSTVSFLIVGMLVVFVLIFINKRNQTLNEYYDKKVAAFKEENLSYSKGQIVFLGDSITDFCPLENYYGDLDKKTYNRGIGGDTTTGVIKRLQVSIYDLEPSEIVLLIGTNDVNHRTSNDAIITNYNYILDDIKTQLPNSKLFAMSVIPQNYDLTVQSFVDESNKRIENLNPRIKQVVEERNYTYLDLFSLVKDESNRLRQDLSDDGIHFNDAGFKVWANLVKPLL